MRRMSILAVIALLLAPVHAQDEADRRKDLTPEQRKLVELVLKLRSVDAEDSEDARRRLLELLLPESGGGRVAFDADAFVLLDPKGPSESIRGSSMTEDGKLEYTLKRHGEGKYELRAKRMDPVSGKVLDEIVDHGTMAELTRKHAFLKRAPARGIGFGGLVVQTSRQPHGAQLLGAFATRPSEELAYHLYLPKGVGYLVRHVPKGSRAETLGLKPFDVLTKADGKWLEDAAQLERARTVEYFRRAAAERITLE